MKNVKNVTENIMNVVGKSENNVGNGMNDCREAIKRVSTDTGKPKNGKIAKTVKRLEEKYVFVNLEKTMEEKNIKLKTKN